MANAKITKVGNAVIFPEQLDAAEKCVKILLERKRIPLLCGEMQQGKTGTVIALIHDMYQRAKKLGKTLHVIMVIADARDELTGQTKDRLNQTPNSYDEKGNPNGANLENLFILDNNKKDDYVLDIVHRSTLDSKEAPKIGNHDWLLIIVDESHIGQVKYDLEKQIVRGVVNRFLDSQKMNYGNSPDTWGKSRTTKFLMSVSATDLVSLAAEETESTFERVFMKRAKGYIGIPELMKERILALNEPVMRQRETSVFFQKTILPRFEKECREHGPGHCIIRLSGKVKVNFIKWCKKNKYAYIEATLSSGRLKDINSILLDKPKHPTFLIISGGFRAGMTYASEKNIRMVVETTGMGERNIESLMQAVGRSCGNGKKDYTYPIFCKRKDLEGDTLRFIESLRNGEPVFLPKTKKLVRGSGRTKLSYRLDGPREKKYDRKIYTVKRQSEYAEDFTKVIVNGSRHLGYGKKKKVVLLLDGYHTNNGIEVANLIPLGCYVAEDDAIENPVEISPNLSQAIKKNWKRK